MKAQEDKKKKKGKKEKLEIVREKKRFSGVYSKRVWKSRKRNGPKNHERQAICRAINLSPRPDITRALLTHKVYEMVADPERPNVLRRGKLLRRFAITRTSR